MGTGRPRRRWSEAWLETPGPNVLRAEFRTDAADRFTEFTVVQAASQRHPVLRPHRVAVGLYRRSGDWRPRKLVRVGRAVTSTTGERHGGAVACVGAAARPDLILLNDDDTGYVVVRFDPRSMRTALSSVGRLPDLAARAVCWNAIIDMVRQAELPVTAFAAMLARAPCGREPSTAYARRPGGSGRVADRAVGREPGPSGGRPRTLLEDGRPPGRRRPPQRTPSPPERPPTGREHPRQRAGPGSRLTDAKPRPAGTAPGGTAPGGTAAPRRHCARRHCAGRHCGGSAAASTRRTTRASTSPRWPADP